MTFRIIAAATLVPIVVVVAAVAFYFTLGRGNSETDSGLITFMSDQDGDGNMDHLDKYVMNPDRSGVRQPTNNEVDDFATGWFPTPANPVEELRHA